MSAEDKLRDYQELALDVFRKKLGSYVTGIHVREDLDQQEEPALFFEVQLGGAAPLPVGPEFIYAHLDLRRALEDLGETRFPYLSTRRIAGGPGDPGPSNFIMQAADRIMAKKRAS